MRWTRGSGIAIPELPLLMSDMELMLERERLLAPGSESNESRLSRVSELCVEGLIRDGTLVSGGGDDDRRLP